MICNNEKQNPPSLFGSYTYPSIGSFSEASVLNAACLHAHTRKNTAVTRAPRGRLDKYLGSKAACFITNLYKHHQGGGLAAGKITGLDSHLLGLKAGQLPKPLLLLMATTAAWSTGGTEVTEHIQVSKASILGQQWLS